MTIPCTGVILCGGLAKRFDGREKAFLRIGKERLLDRIYSVFKELFDDIILVTNTPLQFIEWDLNIVTDLFDIRSSLTGIHAGLFYASNPYAFFSACDAPFLKKEIVEIPLPKHVAVQPPDFKGLNLRLEVKVDDEVKVGTPVFSDKIVLSLFFKLIEKTCV